MMMVWSRLRNEQKIGDAKYLILFLYRSYFLASVRKIASEKELLFVRF
jgi:hypothetical protein